jgi:hypothetical protein
MARILVLSFPRARTLDLGKGACYTSFVAGSATGRLVFDKWTGQLRTGNPIDP